MQKSAALFQHTLSLEAHRARYIMKCGDTIFEPNEFPIREMIHLCQMQEKSKSVESIWPSPPKDVCYPSDNPIPDITYHCWRIVDVQLLQNKH